MITKEELIKNNALYEQEYGVVDSDVDMVNKFIELFQNACNTELPVQGDVVIFTTEYGEFYPKALVSRVDYENKIVEICEQGGGSVGFNKNEYGFGMSVSGGAFSSVPFDKLKPYGRGNNTVWDFGYFGRGRASGAIYFKVPVKRWFCDLNLGKHSTKDYDCYYVSYRPKLPKNSNYHFTAYEHKAWEETEDFLAWLRTYRGVCEHNNGWNVRVWTYKEKDFHVSPEKFESIDAPIDVFLMNGAKRKCKRIYHDDTHTIDKYYVWYHDNNDKKGDDFYNSLSEQNKEIEAYEVDWWTNKTEQIAREEIASGKVKMENIFKYFKNVLDEE